MLNAPVKNYLIGSFLILLKEAEIESHPTAVINLIPASDHEFYLFRSSCLKPEAQAYGLKKKKFLPLEREMTESKS